MDLCAETKPIDMGQPHSAWAGARCAGCLMQEPNGGGGFGRPGGVVDIEDPRRFSEPGAERFTAMGQKVADVTETAESGSPAW